MNTSKIVGFKPRGETIAVLDVGTSKVACFIASVASPDDIRIIGIGHQLSKGIRSGIITDIQEAQTSIIAAVHAAEQMAQQTVEKVAVSLSGMQLHSRHIGVELELAGDAVTERDIADIVQEGRATVRSADNAIIHCIPVSYTLDSARGIQDPREMVAGKLGADLHMITASASMLKNLAHCVARCHLNITDYIVAPHAAAISSLEKDEANLGVMLIEMGAGVTSFSVFNGDRNVYTDAVPIGGMHVTSDIAKGLSTTLLHAERIKTLHGSAIPTSADEQAMIDVPQLGEEDESEANFIPRSMLIGIIRPRLEEIFEMIRGKLEASGFEKHAGRRVVLTGGASQMIGVRELATRILNKQVRLGKPKPIAGLAEIVSGPAFSTPLGMLEHMVKKPIEETLFEPAKARIGVTGTFGKMVSWIKENF